MKDPASPGSNRRETSSVYPLAIVALSVAAIVSTFAISLYSEDPRIEARSFSGILVAYLIACGVLYRLCRKDVRVRSQQGENDIEEQLRILDDANTFFAGSLNTSDTFRLLISRIKEMVPFTGASLLLCDDKRENFVVAEVDGTTDEKGTRLSLDSGVAGRCFAERDVVIDAITTSAAVPLKRNAEVYGVLLFAGDEDLVVEDASVLDAIGERVSPLVLASMAYERSRQNALTDAATALPNERAFHLVLENQVAEAIRKGGSRPLTILSFDLKDFGEISSRYGHAAGDRVLNYVAETAKDNLRQMDFFARGGADEFLAIMPTATYEICREIITRIQRSIVETRISVSDTDAVQIEVNFGWACFGADGETPTALIAAARERKEQSRSSVPGSVLWFPQEVAH